MHINEMNHTAMPRHHLATAFVKTTPRSTNLPRKPAPIGLSREELRKIVVDLIG